MNRENPVYDKPFVTKEPGNKLRISKSAYKAWLLLCLAMLLSMTSAFAEANHPDYINYESCLPMVKEGSEGEKITLKVAIAQDPVGGKWDDLWIKRFVEKYWNVNLEVEQIPEAGLVERVSLMFASGELPDLMINLGLTTSNIYLYGLE